MKDQLSSQVQNVPPADDAVSVREYFDTLWSYRRTIVIALVSVAVVGAMSLVAAYLLTPVERTSSMHFRLLFAGASKGEYPNGSPFGTDEIIGTPVLTKVFDDDELKRFGSYDDFKAALYVLQSNPKLDLLELEYESKLSDTKLTPVDRARIEDEFNKKREAITDPTFSLNIRNQERFGGLPRDLREKILRDTLATWAKQADQIKGATRYNIAVLSRTILQPGAITSDELLVTQDMLRAMARRVLDNVIALERLPGATSFRSGKNGLSLPEVEATLQNLIRFDIEPLLASVRYQTGARSAPALALYAESQLSHVQREYDVATSRIRALQDALRDYTAQRGSIRPSDVRSGGSASGGSAGNPGTETPTIPQLGDSFMDRLMQMSTQSQASDIAFRQKLTTQIVDESTKLSSTQEELAYYTSLVKFVRTDAGTAGSAVGETAIKDRSAKILTALGATVDRVVDIYNELSVQNLNPSTVLYAVTAPFAEHADRPVKVATLALYFLLILLAAVLIVPLACLVHHAVTSGHGIAAPGR